MANPLQVCIFYSSSSVSDLLQFDRPKLLVANRNVLEETKTAISNDY